ncbi:MAG: TonB-dependent receptor [Bacteroidetes bacterium]|nr:TonB-dependent receptor [Bacteroidota bacterium]
MKLAGFLIFICCMQASANGFAQQVTLHESNASLEKIFETIKKQTGYVFWFEDKTIQHAKNINITLKDATIDEALDACLKDQSLSYEKIGKTIVIKPALVQKVDTLNAKITPPKGGIKGKIVNENDQPLPGATLVISRLNKSFVADASGEFSIDGLNEGEYELSVSYIGYQQTKIKVEIKNGLPTDVVIKLTQSVNAINEVVVVGYGTQQKKDITGAISVVSSKALEDRPNTEFGYSLEGKAAGVQIIRSSGQPQAGFSIRIRGVSTITSGSEPLYIVDGVPTASINEINPADIESFSILKDASSAAIYGSSGANGVVLITTKRGKSGATKLNLDIYNGTSSVWRKLPVLNSTEYEELMSDMGMSANWSQYNDNTNWQDELFRTAHSQNYQLSVSGGNEKTNFYLSGDFVKDDGVVIGNTMNRTNFKINLDHRINKIFKIGTSVSYDRWFDVDVSENSRNGSILNAILGSPVIGVWDSTGKEYTTDPFRNDLDNPVALADGFFHNYSNQRFNGNAYIEANLFAGLKLRSMFGYEKYNGIYNYYVDPYKTVTGRGFNGQAELSQNDNQYWISESTINYSKSFGKHSISALAGFIVSKTTSAASDIITHNFANPAITTVNGGSVVDHATATADAQTTTSAISRITYDYAEKYLLTVNMRADAASVFGPDNRWGYFPSFSAGWRISKEKFFDHIAPIINDLKVRGSWGIVGNSQIGAYSYLGTVAPTGSYVIGGNVVAGYLPVSLENPSLKWETTKQTDIGIDAAFLDSKIVFTADYYYKKTTGLLLDAPVPASSGYTSALKNIGDLQNTGFEFQISTKNISKKDFEWSTDFNISFNKNKVLNIAGGTIYDGPIDERGNTSIVQAGLPLGSFFGYVAEGVNKKTGNMIYKMADKSAGLQTSDMQVIGNANPDFYYGLTNDVEYKNWSLTVFVQGVQGNDIFNATRIYSEGLWEPRNQSTAVLRRWTKPGQVTDIPRQDLTNYTTPFANYNSLISSRFVENGSYLRIKSLTLAYNFSSAVLTKLKIQKIKLYVTGENLLTLTGYSGFDPEVSAFSATDAGSQSNNVAPGIDFGTYPQTRDIIFGLSVGF